MYKLKKNTGMLFCYHNNQFYLGGRGGELRKKIDPIKINYLAS